MVKDLSEDFLAATLGEMATPESPTVFVPQEERFYRYAPDAGIFVEIRESRLLAMLSEVLLACGMMVAVGALDDRFDLRPRYRVAVHLAAAVTLVMATGFRVDSLGNLFGLGEIVLGPFDCMFTVLATVALINAFNMLDGVDGIAGGVALVALAGLSFHLVPAGNLAAAATLALAGAVVGFLVFNLPNAGRPRGLTGKGALGRMIAAYDAFRHDGRLPATYEVGYGHAWRPATRARQPEALGEVRVPLGSIGRRQGK